MGNEGHEGVHNLTKHSHYKDALSEPLIVIDCMATWCGPCKTIAPKIVKFAKEYPTVKFFKLDIDEVPDVAQELGIRAMPTFILFKNGEKVGEVVGANEKALEAAIKKEVESMGGHKVEL